MCVCVCVCERVSDARACVSVYVCGVYQRSARLVTHRMDMLVCVRVRTCACMCVCMYVFCVFV